MTPSAHINDFIDQTVPPEDRAEAKMCSSVVCATGSGNPVIYVSDAFEAHTGYAPSQIVGRNLSILQGPDTEPEAVEYFRELIRDGKPGMVRITNYRSDGTKFTHECDFRPVRDAQENVTHFIAIQRPLTA